MLQRRPVPLLKLLNGSGLHNADILGNPDVMVTGIATHAQGVNRNEAFIAVRGTRTDSHAFLAQAAERGASVLVVDREAPMLPGVTQVRVPDTRFAIGPLALAFQGNPTRAMTICGVTGTNGKSSTAHELASILKHAGVRTGLIGTLGAFWGDKSREATTTTPGALELANLLTEMARDLVDTVVMEVSSHAIDQGRVAGIPFRAAAFTNISQDHLDYHGDFPSYIACKRRFFFENVADTIGSVASFNIEDAVGEEMFDSYQGDRLSYSTDPNSSAVVRLKDVRYSPRGTEFTLMLESKERRVRSKLVGQFNLSNILAAVSMAHSLGLDLDQIAGGIEGAAPVPGRFELIDEGQPFTVIVDYAHTPDALVRVLRTARGLTRNRLICVFGCGGDRDRTKRPLMGKAVGENVDYAIITNDNPRTEAPDQIVRGALEGILQTPLKPACHTTILDRSLAIETAFRRAEPGDVIMIAGKGHEDYMEVGRERQPFCDRSISRELLQRLHGHYSGTHSKDIFTEGII